MTRRRPRGSGIGSSIGRFQLRSATKLASQVASRTGASHVGTLSRFKNRIDSVDETGAIISQLGDGAAFARVQFGSGSEPFPPVPYLSPLVASRRLKIICRECPLLGEQRKTMLAMVFRF